MASIISSAQELQPIFSRIQLLERLSCGSVRPLLAWYSLAGTLALKEADRNAVGQAAKDLLSACPRYLGRSSIAAVLEKIRSGGALPASAPRPLVDFAQRIQAAAQLRFASWAILDPLVRA